MGLITIQAKGRGGGEKGRVNRSHRDFSLLVVKGDIFIPKMKAMGLWFSCVVWLLASVLQTSRTEAAWETKTNRRISSYCNHGRAFYWSILACYLFILLLSKGINTCVLILAICPRGQEYEKSVVFSLFTDSETRKRVKGSNTGDCTLSRLTQFFCNQRKKTPFDTMSHTPLLHPCYTHQVLHSTQTSQGK